jgi:type III pantothenate kinase
MKPAVVVDVGNTRIKWGRCAGDTVTEVCSLPHGDTVTEVCSLPHGDTGAWQRQLTAWALDGHSLWVVTGVQPARRDQLSQWLQQQGQVVRLLDDPSELPLRVLLERPDHVGVDRLLDAVAANSRRSPDRSAVIIDAGSAVTVDLLDETGAFVGGVILPGFRLMARALHDYTALLPLIETPTEPPPLPGKSTPAALAAGLHASVAGGIRYLLDRYRGLFRIPPQVFLTGGDTALLQPALPDAEPWPLMTLEGIRLAAEKLS